MNDVLKIWSAVTGTEASLKRLSCQDRVANIRTHTGIDKVIPLEKGKYSVSSKLWYNCLISNQPLDSIDGLELYRRELYPWQDKEYISYEVGLDPAKFENGEYILRHLQPFSREKLKIKSQNLNS